MVRHTPETSFRGNLGRLLLAAQHISSEWHLLFFVTVLCIDDVYLSIKVDRLLGCKASTGRGCLAVPLKLIQVAVGLLEFIKNLHLAHHLPIEAHPQAVRCFCTTNACGVLDGL